MRDRVKQSVDTTTNKVFRATSAIVGIMFFALFVVMLSIVLSDDESKIYTVTGVVESVEARYDTYDIYLASGERYEFDYVVAENVDADLLDRLVGDDVTLYVYPDEPLRVILGIDSSVMSLSADKGYAMYHGDNVAGAWFFAIWVLVCLAVFVVTLVQKREVEMDVVMTVEHGGIQIPQLVRYKRSISTLKSVGWIGGLTLMAIGLMTQDEISLVIGIGGIILLAVCLYVASDRQSRLRLANIACSLEMLSFSTSRRDHTRVRDAVTSLTFDVGADGLTCSRESNLDECSEFLEDWAMYQTEQDPHADADALRTEMRDKIAEELHLDRYDGLTLSYADLKLYTKVVFYRDGVANVYVASSLGERTDLPLEHNLLFRLDNATYNALMEHRVDVRGLRYFLSHKEQILEEGTKSRVKVMDYRY